MNDSYHVLFYLCHCYPFYFKNCFSTITSFIKVNTTDRISVLLLCARLIFFGCLLNHFPPIVVDEVNIYLQFCIIFWELSSSRIIQFPNYANTLQLEGHLLAPSQIIHLILLNLLIYIYFQNMLPFSPS